VTAAAAAISLEADVMKMERAHKPKQILRFFPPVTKHQSPVTSH